MSGFDPRSISGCVLWLDGADPNATGVLPSNGSTISTWTDKSVYGNNATLSVLQGTPSAPTFSTSISPGSVAFDGTSQLLGVSNLTADSSANTGESGFAVVNLTNYTNVNTIFGAIAKSGQTYNTAGRQFRLDAGTIRTNRQASTTLLTTSSSPSFSNSTTYLVEFVNTNFNNNSSGTATLTHYQNGTLLGTFTYTTSSTTNNYQTGLTTSIGGRGLTATTYSEYSAGNFMELLLYNSGVTQADRQLIEGYLAWKWGLQSSLPATHPYRSSLGIKPFSRLFWSPDVTGLVFWIDASGGTSTGLTINGSNNVTAVTDLSGYGSNSTSVSGTAAYLTNVHPSGLGAISLCKTGAINFPGTYAMNTIGAGYDYALICTCSFSAFTTVNFPAQNIYAKTANNPTLYFYFSGGFQLFRHLSSVNGSSININVSNPLSANQWSIITLLCRRGINNQIYLTFNGAWNWASPAATGATFETTANTGAFVLGANYDAANPTVYFGEVMCIVGPTGTSATRTQIQSAEAYLAKKWGTRSTFSSTHPFYNYIHSSPKFNPLQVSGLSLWLDALNTNSYTSTGTTLNTIADVSGNGITFTGTTGATIGSTLFNSKYPSFYTTSTSSILGISGTNTFSLPQPFTVFMIGQVSTGGTLFSAIATTPLEGISVPLTVYTSGTSNLTTMRASTTGLYPIQNNNQSGNLTVTNPFISCITFNSSSSTIYNNGTLAVTGSLGTQGFYTGTNQAVLITSISGNGTTVTVNFASTSIFIGVTSISVYFPSAAGAGGTAYNGTFTITAPAGAVTSLTYTSTATGTPSTYANSGVGIPSGFYQCGTLQVGGTGSNATVGHLCEVLFYSGTLTTNQRQLIEGYLTWKWGINSKLSSTHPYYKVMP